MEGAQLRLYEAVEEAVLGCILVDHLVGQIRCNASEALAGNKQLGGYDLIAQADGLTEEGLVEVHVEQPLPGGVARVEQADVYLVGTAAEVVAQDAVVEQQLHVVVFLMLGVGQRAFYLHVAPRLLLHQQVQVARHQVDTPLQAQPLAYERGLEQRLLALEALLTEERMRCLLNVLGLHHGIAHKGLAVEALTGAHLQSLLA